MNKKGFDFSLYKETLRQGKAAALIAELIFVLEAILIPVGRVVSSSSLQNGVFYSMEADFWSMHPVAVTSYCIFAPLLTIYLFRFLNRRDGSDFYHAIPNTRKSMFLSMVPASFTLVMLVLWSSSLVSAVTYEIFGRYFVIDWGNFLCTILKISLCSACVTGAVMIAVSLTGNTFSNILVSLLVIFAPRLIMLAVSGMIDDSLSVVDFDFITGFSGFGWNMVTDSVLGFYGGASGYFGDLKSVIYTLILTAGYLVLGCMFFARRKSEMAGEAAASRGMQLVFRLLPAAVFSLIAADSIFMALVLETDHDGSFWFLIIVLYLITALLYLGYEIVSTRSLSGILKSIPGMSLIVLFDAALIGIMLLIRTGILSYAPSAENITSVTLNRADTRNWNSYIGDYSSDYFAGQLDDPVVEDPEVISLVAGRLSDTIRWEKCGEDYESIYGNGNQNFEYPEMRTVVIDCAGSKKTRNINFTDEDLDILAKAYVSLENVAEVYEALPDADQAGVTIDYSYGTDDIFEPDDEDLKDIYHAFCEDVKGMSVEEWYEYYEECRTEGYHDGNVYLVMDMLVKGENGVSAAEFSVTDITPKALAAYKKVCE